MKEPEVINADILVSGGAITGMWAAIRAKQIAPESEVLLVDKGRASKSGCANWGAGNTSCMYPTDDVDELKKRFIDAGEGLVDEEWLDLVWSGLVSPSFAW